MVRTQIQLTDAQAEALRAEASRLRVSIAELVRRAVDRLLSEQSGDGWQRFDDLAGAFASGSNDVAERHDDYLAEDVAERLRR